MKRNSLQKLFFLTTLWFFAFVVAFAQAPAADIDSITEDSYRRMQKRQAAEKISDSLLRNQSELEDERLKLVKQTFWNNVIVIFVIVGVVFVYWYIRRTSKTRDSLKK